MNSVIAVYYYLRPVVAMYMSESSEPLIVRSGVLTRMTLVLMAIATIVFGVAASPVLQYLSVQVLNRL
jgi:NADH-quinone oxidoreductase subunit N